MSNIPTWEAVESVIAEGRNGLGKGLWGVLLRKQSCKKIEKLNQQV